MSNRVIMLSKRPSYIKNIYTINREEENIPTVNRQDKNFCKYYDLLWKDLANES